MSMDGYQKTNASRYQYGTGHQSPTRCSCTGVIIALIVIGILITIPSILGGAVVFVGFMDNPILYILSSLSLYGPLVLCVVVVWFVWNRRKKGIPADL